MKLSEDLKWRGLVNQTTYQDLTAIDGEPLTFYWGVDPSADSVTIGNLAAALVVRRFLEHGHKLVLLVGGATGMIGDPDGKKDEREVREEEKVRQNVKALIKQLSGLFDGLNFEVVDNNDWFKDIGYIDFLHRVGKHVSMTQMLDREFVQSRIGEGGSGISYGEFSYALIQGYDFVHLFREKGVTLQLAGADQWGNSIMGVSLVRKLAGGEVNIFTTPLIVNKQTGVKFGKSEAGAVWLDPNKTSPYQFYQFWLNLDDDMSEDLIKVYTLLDKEVIESTIAEHRTNPSARILQKTLAGEVTKIVHGETRRQSVERVSAVLFGEAEYDTLDVEDLSELASEIPTLSSGKSLVDSLIETGLASGRSDARRLIEAGAISFNQVKLTADQNLTEPGLLKRGKNQFALITEGN